MAQHGETSSPSLVSLVSTAAETAAAELLVGPRVSGSELIGAIFTPAALPGCASDAMSTLKVWSWMTHHQVIRERIAELQLEPGAQAERDG